MKKPFIKSQKHIVIIALVDIIAVIGIIFLMNYVQILLNADVRINLSEIVTQNKNVITSKIALELNEMTLEAKQLTERLLEKDGSQAELDSAFMDFIKEKEDNSLVYATVDGRALSAKGKEFDISGRAYFKLGIEGTPTISERVVSRENGADVFVFCVPLVKNEQIYGTIQKQYTPSEMYSLCSVSLFSEKGTTFIINSDGYILISSENSEYTLESSNYYRQIMYPTDPEAAKELENDIRANRSGFMNAVIDGQKVFFAYTPIEQIHDWYLISSIPTSTVSPNANVVIKIFYYILFAAALMFTISLLYFWALKKKQQKALETVAFVDEVTGGDSFTKFSVELEQSIYSQSVWPLYICAFDIDNFKYINSFYSYEAGNIILAELHSRYSERLQANERIARMTADKFVMLLSDASDERLASLIEFEHEIDGIKIYISAGLYQVPDYPQSVGLMVDKAFMSAKRIKGMHFKHVERYSEDFDEENAHNEQIKRALEDALENDEIIPFFQPKVNIDTGVLIGAEALARWQKPDGTLVPPADFIPICEKTGLITLVDMTVFEQALKFLQANLNQGVNCVPISVNFSKMHLLNDEFVDTIISKIKEYNIPPELIELELTETVIFENYETITRFIQTIHEHGLRISMDDFGTGYSSLHMLKDTDIDVLKIDRGFLLDSESSSRQKTIFGAIVQMAKQLNIEVIVEGVETDDNVALLREFGCSNAQGYYYARPMHYTAFEKIFKDGMI